MPRNRVAPSGGTVAPLRRAMVLGLTALVLAVPAVGAAACDPDRYPASGPAGSADPARRISTAAPVPGYNPELTVLRGPRPPASGAWLGAWVKSDWQSPAGRAEAFAEFEKQVGAELPIAHIFRPGTDEFPAAVEAELARRSELLLVSWAGTDTRSIRSGSYDALIRQRAEAVKALGVPLLLRFRWEMDRPNLQASVHSPEDYVAAWRHARRIFTEVGAVNAAWVWCPHAHGFFTADRDASAYYPGDDQVDWLCTDVYDGAERDGFAAQMDPFLAFAQQHPKPVIIGEFGVTDDGDGARRAAWLREVRDYVKRHPQIKALVYFAEKMTRRPYFNTTLASDPAALAAFRELVADPYFATTPPARR